MSPAAIAQRVTTATVATPAYQPRTEARPAQPAATRPRRAERTCDACGGPTQEAIMRVPGIPSTMTLVQMCSGCGKSMHARQALTPLARRLAERVTAR